MFDPAGPVLGIDPGLSRCGYGAVRHDRGTSRAVSFGELRTDPGDDLPVRLAVLAADLRALIAELAPSALAVERVLFQANVRTAISVGQASGLALAAAAGVGIPVAHYSPNEVKLAVTGSGSADKAQVQAMVSRLLTLDAEPPPDAADALALALCHSWSSPLVAAASAGSSGERAQPASPGALVAVKSDSSTVAALEHAIAAAVARDGAA
jgi:crossover junction endodeoxyribonuclease RuvC